jgi:putative DNA primase/helicase
MLDVLVLPSKFIGSGAEGGLVMPLGAALTRRFNSDAHMVCYSHPVRLKKNQISEVSPPFGCAVFDLDDSDAHESGAARSEDFTELMYEAQVYLSTKLKTDVGMYCTKGGGRLIVPYQKSIEAELHKSFVGACLHLLKKGGFSPDDLKDTTRLFRLPSVLRDNVMQEHPCDFEDMGAVSMDTINSIIGAWRITNPPEETRTRFTLPDRIGNGERNTLLTRYAGSLRRGGMSPEQIFEELSKINEDRVDPPMGDEELAHIAESVGSYPVENTRSLGNTDTLDADDDDNFLSELGHGSEQNIADACVLNYQGLGGGELLYDRNRLWSYESGYWKEISEKPLFSILRTFDGARYIAGRNNDGSIRFGIIKMGDRLYSNVINVIKRSTWREGFFDEAPIGLVFNDGFLDARTLSIKSNSPDNRALTSVPMDWNGEREEPKIWEETLRDIFSNDPDCNQKIELLEEFIGVGLLGAATKLQRGLILLGGGANGKSTVLEVVERIFKWSGAKTTALAPQNLENDYNRDMLAGARLNVCNEMPESDILVGSAVKATISGDIQTARKIREAPYSFRPTALQLFAANFLPSVSDSSQGFWRRWCILEFNRSFKPHERDPYRAERIMESELEAITKRCVQRGLTALKRRRYNEPDSSINAVSNWQTQADQVASWVKDSVEILGEDDKGQWATPTELYENYTTWCSTTGHRAMSKHKFGRRIKELGINYYNSNGGRKYGCRVKAPDLRLV